MVGGFSDAFLVVETVDSFKENFSDRLPDFLSIAPGRINIIGEHLDYEDYAVLPMAIDRYTTCAVRRVVAGEEEREGGGRNEYLSDSHPDEKKEGDFSSGCGPACSLRFSSSSSYPPRSPLYESADSFLRPQPSSAPSSSSCVGCRRDGEAEDTTRREEEERQQLGKEEREKEGERNSASAASYIPFLQIAHTHRDSFPGCSVRTLEDLPVHLLHLREKAVREDEGADREEAKDNFEEEEEDEEAKKIRKKSTWQKYVLSGMTGLLEYIIGERNIDLVGRCLAPENIKRRRKTDEASPSTQPFQEESSSSFSPPSWFKKAVQKTFPQTHGCPGHFQILIGGNLPTASGLSSSSSLVVASIVGLSAALQFRLTREEIAEISTRAERHAGTAGGGMDQAVIALSEENSATLISCFPRIQAESIPLPSKSVVFAVAHTLVDSPKASHAATHFNKRVFECLLASLLLLRKIKEAEGESSASLPHGETLRTWTLRKTQEACHLQSFEDCLSATEKHLHDGEYEKEEILDPSVLGKDLTEEILQVIPVMKDVWRKNQTFLLKKRALHVFSEAGRVLEFVSLCKNSNPSLSLREKLRRLADLMVASHRSCSKNFECSCEESNRLVEFSIHKGQAVGSRMTGAGWGGCTISLLENEQAGQAFVKKLRPLFSRSSSSFSTSPSFSSPEFAQAKEEEEEENSDQALPTSLQWHAVENEDDGKEEKKEKTAEEAEEQKTEREQEFSSSSCPYGSSYVDAALCNRMTDREGGEEEGGEEEGARKRREEAERAGEGEEGGEQAGEREEEGRGGQGEGGRVDADKQVRVSGEREGFPPDGPLHEYHRQENPTFGKYKESADFAAANFTGGGQESPALGGKNQQLSDSQAASREERKDRKEEKEEKQCNFEKQQDPSALLKTPTHSHCTDTSSSSSSSSNASKEDDSSAPSSCCLRRFESPTLRKTNREGEGGEGVKTVLHEDETAATQKEAEKEEEEEEGEGRSILKSSSEKKHLLTMGVDSALFLVKPVRGVVLLQISGPSLDQKKNGPTFSRGREEEDGRHAQALHGSGSWNAREILLPRSGGG